MAERLRKAVEDMEIILEERGEFIRITASFGVATLRKEPGETVAALAKRGDDVMYTAKEQGRNRVCLAP